MIKQKEFLEALGCVQKRAVQSQTSSQSVNGIKDTDKYLRRVILGRLEATNVTTPVDTHMSADEKLNYLDDKANTGEVLQVVCQAGT